MTRSFLKSKKGFTLIELLVVIAIIGVLASIVLASLNTARRKGRDTRRVADMGQIRLALELFFDANRNYPSCSPCAWPASIAALAPTYIGQIPSDPTSGATYAYQSTNNDSPLTTCAATCQGYVIQARLEEGTNQALGTDFDLAAALGAVTCTDGGGVEPPVDANRYYCVRN